MMFEELRQECDYILTEVIKSEAPWCALFADDNVLFGDSIDELNSAVWKPGEMSRLIRKEGPLGESQ